MDSEKNFETQKEASYQPSEKVKSTESLVKNLSWIRDLIKMEEQIEQAGVFDSQAGSDKEKILFSETTSLLQKLKAKMLEACHIFNELKPSALGRVKVYGIAKTEADFMLFRGGYKMIFSMQKPGLICIRFHFVSGSFIPSSGAQSQGSLMEDDFIESRWGAFNEVNWFYKNDPVQLDSALRYYLSRFICESAK